MCRVGKSRLEPRTVKPLGCELWEYRLNRPDRPFFSSRRGSFVEDSESHFDEWERREDCKNRKWT